MSNVTTLLAEESGIQYQGVGDKSGGTGEVVTSTLMTGKFRRGVFGRTMTITTANIRGMLGFEPKNPDYQAVEDALSTGVPSVQVLRLNDLKDSEEEGGGSGGSAGLTAGQFVVVKVQPGASYRLKVDGVPVVADDGTSEFVDIHKTTGMPGKLFFAASYNILMEGVMIQGLNFPGYDGMQVFTSEPAIVFALTAPTLKPVLFELEGPGISTFPEHHQKLSEFFSPRFDGIEMNPGTPLITATGASLLCKPVWTDPRTIVQVGGAKDFADNKKVKVRFASNEFQVGQAVNLNIYSRNSDDREGIIKEKDIIYATIPVTVPDTQGKGYGYWEINLENIDIASKNLHTTTSGTEKFHHVLLGVTAETSHPIYTNNAEFNIPVQFGITPRSVTTSDNKIYYDISFKNFFRNMEMTIQFNGLTDSFADKELMVVQNRTFDLSTLKQVTYVVADITGVTMNPYNCGVVASVRNDTARYFTAISTPVTAE